MSCLEVKRIRTKINLVVPNQLTRLPDPYPFKESVVGPCRKYPLTNEPGKIDDAALAVVERQFQPVIFEDSNMRYFVHRLFYTRFHGAPQDRQTAIDPQSQVFHFRLQRVNIRSLVMRRPAGTTAEARWL